MLKSCNPASHCEQPLHMSTPPTHSSHLPSLLPLACLPSCSVFVNGLTWLSIIYLVGALLLCYLYVR
jgi:hypothetical protein